MSTHTRREPGFEEPIPMAGAAPGVMDLIALYNQYSEQLRLVVSYQRAFVCTSGATAGVDLVPDAHLG